MPRSLPSAIQQAILADNCSLAHLLAFSVGETTYRYSEDDRSFLGNLYNRGLRIITPIRTSSQLRTDAVQVSIENISLDMSSLLTSVAAQIQGQEAAIDRLFPHVSQSIPLFRGRISEVEVDEHWARLTLVTDLDPAATSLPLRLYSALCAWTFADAHCGYLAAEGPLDPETAAPYTTCPKDFHSCEARGRPHRFSGFIHLTREVSENNS